MFFFMDWAMLCAGSPDRFYFRLSADGPGTRPLLERPHGQQPLVLHAVVLLKLRIPRRVHGFLV